MGLPQYAGKADLHVEKMFYTGTTALIEGEQMAYASNADPDNSAFASLPPGSAVTQMGAETGLFAGILAASSAGSTGGWVNVIRPKVNDVVTIAVAVGIDLTDGAVITASQTYAADGGAFDEETDQWYPLYDEDNANNPHGTSAISASIGLVEAVFTGNLKFTP